MMQLSSMRKVVGTVDSEWKSPLAEEILRHWGYDEGSVYYFRASANFIFVFRKEGKRYFLRFIEDNQKSLQEIETEIKILTYLDKKSLIVAQPILSLNHRFVETVNTELGTFYAVVFNGLEGNQYEVDDLNPKQFFEWGRSLGNLHRVFKHMPEEYKANKPSWKEHLSFVKETISHNDKVVLKEWEQIYNWANQLKMTNDNFGMIHYDFELDNLSITDDDIGILDFDDCSNYWFAADIAFALRDVFKADVDLLTPDFQKFVEGYTSETNIEVEMLQEIPWFLRMHKLVMYAKLLRAVDMDENEENPEWLTGLKNKLMNYISNYRLSLE
jgi:Ser/Thr protein kinase RdoA (MazF antagonist)